MHIIIIVSTRDLRVLKHKRIKREVKRDGAVTEKTGGFGSGHKGVY